MLKFSDLLNENIQQALAYLRTKNIDPEDDYAFQVIIIKKEEYYETS